MIKKKILAGMLGILAGAAIAFAAIGMPVQNASGEDGATAGTAQATIRVEIQTKGDVTDDEFTVRMTAQDDAPLPEGKSGSYDLKLSKPGKAAFPTITYTKLGVNYYTVTQVPGSAKGAKYDKSVYHVKVSVIRDTETNKWQTVVAIRKEGEEDKLDLCTFLDEYPTIIEPTTPPPTPVPPPVTDPPTPTPTQTPTPTPKPGKPADPILVNQFGDYFE